MSKTLNGLIAKRNDLTLTPENFPPLQDLQYMLAEVDAEEMHLLEEEEDDEPTCPRCGGPIYSQPHWSYWQCDDCGYSEKKEEMDP